jgi:uncharacterized protein Yka (UPF0111/DUF47 family)
MNLAEKINTLCNSIEEMSELNTIVEANDESVKLAQLVSVQINLLLDKLNNLESTSDQIIISLIKELQEKYLQNPEQVINWNRIELFEALMMLENIKLQLNSRN